MKKIIAIAILAVGSLCGAHAQDISKNALGLRIGGDSQFGVGINYQRALQKNNRLELELGWRNSSEFNAVKVTGIYQWVWNIDGGFNWYAGPGIGIGSYTHKYKAKGVHYKDSGAYGLITGNIGIEYNFSELPLQLSVDFRPEIYLNDTYRDGIYGDFGIGIRYKF